MQWLGLLWEVADWLLDAVTAFGQTPEGGQRLAQIEQKLISLQTAENSKTVTTAKR